MKSSMWPSFWVRDYGQYIVQILFEYRVQVKIF